MKTTARRINLFFEGKHSFGRLFVAVIDVAVDFSSHYPCIAAPSAQSKHFFLHPKKITSLKKTNALVRIASSDSKTIQ
jgi:hypothetical protein